MAPDPSTRLLDNKQHKYTTLNESADEVYFADEATHGKPSKEATANFLSQWFFWWVNSLIVLGYQRPLQHEDLPAVIERDDAARYVC